MNGSEIPYWQAEWWQWTPFRLTFGLYVVFAIKYVLRQICQQFACYWHCHQTKEQHQLESLLQLPKLIIIWEPKLLFLQLFPESMINRRLLVLHNGLVGSPS